MNITEDDVARWLAQLESARLSLVAALGEPEDPDSSSECVLLAIPFMRVAPQGVDAVDELVDSFLNHFHSMPPQARVVLAEYGRRWEVILDATVPVEHPCTVDLVEQRPWVDAPSSTLRLDLPWADAVSSHIEIRAADHGVVISDASLLDVGGQRMERRFADAERRAADAISFYASDRERPYMVTVSLTVRLRRAQRLTMAALMLLIGGAAGTALSLPENEATLVDSLALLTFPLTLAGAVVLTREVTPLAERLLRHWRSALLALVIALWTITLARLLLAADVAWAESLSDAIKRTMSAVGCPMATQYQGAASVLVSMLRSGGA